MEIFEDKFHPWINSARYVKPKPGIYVLYNKKGETIYIGESDNLQNQFSVYLDTDFENNPCKQKTHTYQRFFTENPKEEKKALLEEFRVKNGRFPECNYETD